MNDQGLSSDIISTLPQNIAEHILTLIPIKDALRTSVLSSKWRYTWTTIPKLVFHFKLFKVEYNSTHSKRRKFFDAIIHVFLFHKGPILEFNLYVDKIDMISKCDQIILHLSRRNDLKTLKIAISNTLYKLPISFFSLQGLEDLELTSCDFQPPLLFSGFSRLRKLWFQDVKVPEKMLQCFLSNCPLVEKVILNGYENEFAEVNKFTFVEFLRCVPLIEILDLSSCYMKYFATGGMPRKLHPSLVHLKYLYLDVCLMEKDEISSALCMIRSAPNLQEISFLMYDNEKLPLRPISMNFFDPQNHSDLDLDHLEELEMQMFSNLPIEWDFVKLIMAKSPVLKRTIIEFNDTITIDEELKMLRDLIELPFPRASPSAKLKIERPKPST